MPSKFIDIDVLPECLIFQGAPDILICDTVTHLVDTSGDVDNSQDEIIENCLQRSKLKSRHGIWPEKLGEVCAGLYFLLVSKALRDIKQDVIDDKEYFTKGMLLDKIIGVVHCKLVTRFVTTDAVIGKQAPGCVVICRDPAGNGLNVQSLCYHLNTLFTW